MPVLCAAGHDIELQAQREISHNKNGRGAGAVPKDTELKALRDLSHAHAHARRAIATESFRTGTWLIVLSAQ